MEILFYLLSVITIMLTIAVVLSVYPVYSLLFLISSFLSMSCIFFILDATLAGVLEVIIYAGAVMVLFIFVVMMLNIELFSIEKNNFIVHVSCKKLLLLFLFLIIYVYIWSGASGNYISNMSNNDVFRDLMTLKSIGLMLFGPYILLVEMASILLLSALVITLHVGRSVRCNASNKEIVSREC